MFRRMTRDRFLSDRELAAFMAAVAARRHKNQPRDHALFALLSNTGIRPSEALALTLGDLHLGAREPWIRLHRGHRPHWPYPVNELILNHEIAGVVRRYSSSLAGPAETKLFRFTKRQSARLFRYYADLAGIPARYPIYCLRHTVGMRLWRYTKDLRLIQGIMGHVSLMPTMGYVHTPPGEIEQAMRAAQGASS